MLIRRSAGEFIGTALLLIAIIGSGIAASRLSPSDTGLALFENAAATGAALVAIILAVGPVSGAHLNPIITMVDRMMGGMSTREAVSYVAAQVTGGCLGAVLANLMFSLPAVSLSTRTRSGAGLWLGEIIATFGLVLVVFGVLRSGKTGAAPYAVGTYIAAAYFFTSSTSFANPAVTLGRSLSDTFAGIAPASVPAFITAQFIGAVLSLAAVWLLYPDAAATAGDLLVPHSHETD